MPRDDDDNERLLCRKNPGKRGQVFEEWLKEYLDACGAKGDEEGRKLGGHLPLQGPAGRPWPSLHLHA